MSGGPYIRKRQWRYKLSTWLHVQFVWVSPVFLVKFSYWSNFDVNIMTGSGVKTILTYKGLTGIPEIWNSPVWVVPNVLWLENISPIVRHTKFGTNVSNKKLLNAGKFQGYGFYRFWVIKGKPTARRPSIHTHTHTQISVKSKYVALLNLSIY